MRFFKIFVKIFIFLKIFHQLNGATYVRVKDQNQRQFFSRFTILYKSFLVTNRFECFKYCSRKNTCQFIEYSGQNCSLFNFLLFRNSILNGKFWIKKIMVQFNESYPGLTTKYSISSLLSVGFIIVYDRYYSDWTNSKDLENIRADCNENSVMCAGGGSADSDILELVSCANCRKVLTPTSLNNPVYVDSAFWYMTFEKSFGFSPNSQIDQNQADVYDILDNFRLSWHLDLFSGGWRLGNLSGLNEDIQNKKYVFIRI